MSMRRLWTGLAVAAVAGVALGLLVPPKDVRPARQEGETAAPVAR